MTEDSHRQSAAFDDIARQALAMAKEAQQLTRSHAREDELMFGHLRGEIKELKDDIERLNTNVRGIEAALMTKLESVKDLIGARPTWTVALIISTLLSIIGFLSARVFT